MRFVLSFFILFSAMAQECSSLFSTSFLPQGEKRVAWNNQFDEALKQLKNSEFPMSNQVEAMVPVLEPLFKELGESNRRLLIYNLFGTDFRKLDELFFHQGTSADFEAAHFARSLIFKLSFDQGPAGKEALEKFGSAVRKLFNREVEMADMIQRKALSDTDWSKWVAASETWDGDITSGENLLRPYFRLGQDEKRNLVQNVLGRNHPVALDFPYIEYDPYQLQYLAHEKKEAAREIMAAIRATDNDPKLFNQLLVKKPFSASELSSWDASFKAVAYDDEAAVKKIMEPLASIHRWKLVQEIDTHLGSADWRMSMPLLHRDDKFFLEAGKSLTQLPGNKSGENALQSLLKELRHKKFQL